MMLWYRHAQAAYENWANSWGNQRRIHSELSLPCRQVIAAYCQVSIKDCLLLSCSDLQSGALAETADAGEFAPRQPETAETNTHFLFCWLYTEAVSCCRGVKTIWRINISKTLEQSSPEVVCQSPQLGHFQAHTTHFSNNNRILPMFLIAKKTQSNY